MNPKLSHLLRSAGLALLFSSCETLYIDGYGSYSSSGYYAPSYSCSVAWTAASYDANGFPIYGYSYGRPVYGYTTAGSPIFSINLLYAGCYVPNWGPASWCHSHHHYPHGVHHAPKPPKHHHDHKPGVRPPSHAAVHRHPESVMGKPKPAPSHHASKPVKPSHQANEPGRGPSTISRPVKPQNHNTGMTRPTPRPSTVQRPGASSSTRPAATIKRPGTSSSTRPAATVKLPSASTSTRPAATIKRPSTSTSTRPASTIKQRPSASTSSRPATRPSSSSRRSH